MDEEFKQCGGCGGDIETDDIVLPLHEAAHYVGEGTRVRNTPMGYIHLSCILQLSGMAGSKAPTLKQEDD